MTHSARRINALVKPLDIKTYLEIGVNEGETFKSDSIADRTGVDPYFAFDTEAFRNSTTTFVSSTSDVFFETLPIGKKFDLIFIDGLHTFEQVVRDFSNAVLHTHDKSVIILDDTRPSDVFSALPDQASTIKYRRMFRNESDDWRGDVFMAVFYLADFWPGLAYCTAGTGGNPQTIVWRSNSLKRAPLFNSLEAISRLTFLDFYEHIDMLRSMTEEDALRHCISELTGDPMLRGNPPAQ